MSLFTVIIPVYNRSQQIARSLNSVLNQTFNDFEIIVVDDGSTDQTAAALSSLKKQGSIKVIRHQKNLGVSAARNSAIKSASGEYIALLDSDDEWYPHKLEEDYKYIKQNNTLKIHQSNEEWIRNGVKVNPKFKHMKYSGEIFEKSLELCLISPSSVVLHNSMFEKYGLFDEKMQVCEDYDLWLRIAAHEPVGLIDEKLIVKYGGHADQLSRQVWGMDRYRVYSMLKLYYKPDCLSEQQYNALCTEVINKCIILKIGAEKRGNQKFAALLDRIIQTVDSRSSSRIDFDLLLQQ